MAVAKEVAMEVEAAMVEVATVVVAMEEVEAATAEVATAVLDKEVCGRMVRKMQTVDLQILKSKPAEITT